MSYNINIMPRTHEEWEACVLHYFNLEEERASKDPHYQKQTRKQIEEMFACYRPQSGQSIPDLAVL